MRAFEVYLNRKKLYIAGIGDDGVLGTIINYTGGNGRNKVSLHTGGLISGTVEHLHWGNPVLQILKTGDEVRLKIIETEVVDRPKKVPQRDPKENLAREKRYVRKMARKWGWEITRKPVQKRKS